MLKNYLLLIKKSSYSIVPALYKDDYEKKIVYLEFVYGTGNFLGYLLSSSLYYIGGYAIPILFNALLLILALFGFIYIIPTKLT